MNGGGAKDNWQKALMQCFPHLFGRGGYPTVGRGWLDVLDRALGRIDTVVAFEGAGSWIRIVQIKQKFGTIRIYFEHNRDFSAEGLAVIGEVIELAEARSACTCEECGARGRLYVRDGWVASRCEDHAEGEPFRIRPGWEGLYVKTTYRAGSRVVSCRRYDRDIDVFDEVPLPSAFDDED